MSWPRFVRSRVLIWLGALPLLWFWYFLTTECPQVPAFYKKQTSFSPDEQRVVQSYSSYSNANPLLESIYEFSIDLETGQSKRTTHESVKAMGNVDSEVAVWQSVPGTNRKFLATSALGPKGPFTEVTLHSVESDRIEPIATWKIHGMIADATKHVRCIGDCVASISIDGTKLEFHRSEDGRIEHSIPIRSSEGKPSVTQARFHPNVNVIELVLQDSQREYIDIVSGEMIAAPSNEAEFCWIDRDATVAWFREGNHFMLVSMSSRQITTSFDSEFDVLTFLQFSEPKREVALCDSGIDLCIDIRSIENGELLRRVRPLRWRAGYEVVLGAGAFAVILLLLWNGNVTTSMLIIDQCMLWASSYALLFWRVESTPMAFYAFRWEVACMAAMWLSALVCGCVWTMFATLRWPVRFACVCLICAMQSFGVRMLTRFSPYEADVHIQFGVAAAVQTVIACWLLRSIQINLACRTRTMQESAGLKQVGVGAKLSGVGATHGGVGAKHGGVGAKHGGVGATHAGAENTDTANTDTENIGYMSNTPLLTARSITLREILLGMFTMAVSIVLLVPSFCSTSAIEFLFFNSSLVFVDSIAVVLAALIALSGMPLMGRGLLAMLTTTICLMLHCGSISGWGGYLGWDVVSSNLPFALTLCGSSFYSMSGFRRIGWVLTTRPIRDVMA